jgi:renalase
MKSIAIIGAGIAGLVCARNLRRAGHQVKVFDKGLSLGGRTASRHQWSTHFNHGTPWFQARDPQVRDELKEALQAGVLRQLQPELVLMQNDRPVKQLDNRWIFAGWPTMNRLAYHLAADVPISSGLRVTGLQRRARAHGTDGWVIQRPGQAEDEVFDAVVIAVPAPQASDLLPAGHPWQEEITRVVMAPVMTALATTAEPLDVTWDAAEFVDNPLGKVIRRPSMATAPLLDPDLPEGAFRQPATAESLVLHASQAWSLENLETDPRQAAQALIGALETAVGPLPELKQLGGHRWRFARTALPLGQDFLLDQNLGLGVCGDWCLGSRLEDAWTSGRNLAHHLLTSLGKAEDAAAAPHWGVAH